MLKVWGRTSSSNVQKVLWTCAELNEPFERVDWGGKFGGNQDAAYLAMNPNGKVPTVKDGDLVIWESNTIMRYLRTTRQGARLYPADPARRTLVERWMDWQISEPINAMTELLFGYYRTPPERRDAVALAAAATSGARYWAMVERHLEGRNYLAGDEFTLADICIGMFAHRWHLYPIERPPLPRFKAYYEKLAQRPGFVAHVAGPLS
jgi:glutathione S-transferase